MAHNLKSLAASYEKFQKQLEKMTEFIQENSEMGDSCHVEHQEGDGFVVVSEEGDNAPLGGCLSVIRKKGHLSWDDYCELTI